MVWLAQLSHDQAHADQRIRPGPFVADIEGDGNQLLALFRVQIAHPRCQTDQCIRFGPIVRDARGGHNESLALPIVQAAHGSAKRTKGAPTGLLIDASSHQGDEAFAVWRREERQHRSKRAHHFGVREDFIRHPAYERIDFVDRVTKFVVVQVDASRHSVTEPSGGHSQRVQVAERLEDVMAAKGFYEPVLDFRRQVVKAGTTRRRERVVR